MDTKTKALQMCLTKRLPHHKKMRPVETECFSCFEYEQDLLSAYSAGVRDGEIKASEEACRIMSEAREMLGVFEDHGGHDGLQGKGYLAVLDHIDNFKSRAAKLRGKA